MPGYSRQRAQAVSWIPVGLFGDLLPGSRWGAVEIRTIVRNGENGMTTGKTSSHIDSDAAKINGKSSTVFAALLRLLDWVTSKAGLSGLSALGDIVGPLIQAEELIKLDPEIASRFKVRYHALRERLRARHDRDIVGEIAGTPAIGKLTVEAHARAVVASYCEHVGLGQGDWFERLTREAIAASERAHRLYFR